MATNFTVAVNTVSGGDYTALNTALVACECDLTAAATKVFAHSVITGTMSANTAVTGVTSGATGTCVVCTSSQILIKSIVGTFQSGEVVYETLSVNFITINDAGNSPALVINCAGNGTIDNTAVPDITGYTTSSTNNITINGNNTTGIWDTTKYIISSASFSGVTFTINTDGNVVLNNLQISQSGGGGSGQGLEIKASNININACIIANVVGSGSAAESNNASSVIFENCLAYGNAGVGFQLEFGATAYNCTAVGNTGQGFGVFTSNGATITNCISSGNGGDYSLTSGTITYCVSKDGTASGTGSRKNQTVKFTNSASNNYSLANNDHSSILEGTNLSGTFTTDITGATRQATGNWDIGAFLFSGVQTPLSVIRRNLTPNGTRVGSRQVHWGHAN